MAQHTRSPLVVVAAGGTGGHLFPAEALAIALTQRGVKVDLVTDERVSRYGEFPGRATHVVASATFAGRNLFSLARAIFNLGLGTINALYLFVRLRPAVVVGFGGYPTIPPLFAAVLRNIPTVIHEQNGVLGRANRLLGPRARAIATGFGGIFADNPRLAAKATCTGNPIRPVVVEAAAIPYPGADGPLRILIFGGSQGARIMADVVPSAIELVPMAVQARLSVTQQARAEDIARVRSAYERLGGGRAVLRRFAGPYGGEPYRDLPFGRVHGRRTCRDRTARHPGAVASRARPRSACECQRARKGRRRHRDGAGALYPGSRCCRDRAARSRS